VALGYVAFDALALALTRLARNQVAPAPGPMAVRATG
jgi:hypothetical protein